MAMTMGVKVMTMRSTRLMRSLGGLFAARALLALVAAAAAGAAPFGSADAQQRRPLLLEGKSTLYQRVIAVPGARLAATAGDEAASARPVTPFTVFYVYGRQDAEGQQWLQVGADSTGEIDGFLPAEQAVEWRQALTIGFKDPAKQPRVLLFEERDALRMLVEQNDTAAYEALRQRAIDGNAEESPVAAVQPDGFIDIRRNLYLVPILSHEDVLVRDAPARLLQVASVPLRSAAAEDAYRAGIVFVIDTTKSMQPYIERTRDVVRGVYEQLDAAGLADRVSYGVVGFRGSTEAVPALGYVSRVFADLTGNGEQFLRQVGGVQAANVSTPGFNEDAYAGLEMALDEIDWSSQFARYVVLITDAGPRLAGDPLATSGLSTEALRARLEERGIAPWVIHLKTPAGAEANDHAFAEREYRALSNVEGIGSFYYPIETGSVEDFGSALEAMMEQLTAQVRAAATGFQPLHSAWRSIGEGEDAQIRSFEQKVARLGYALRMDHLRQAGEGDAAPALFNAWLVDRDPASPGERAVDVRVLLTRDQLSDLHGVLQRILERAEEGALAPQSFLDELRSLSAIVSRDPESVGGASGAQGASLAELGYMREYIEGLPYQSEVMNLDLSSWQQWSAEQQFEFINQLDGKVAYYRALHDNLDLWVSLDGGAIDGDSVHPLLLEALP
jgi:serine/threonine-protein kinase PpkA